MKHAHYRTIIFLITLFVSVIFPVMAQDEDILPEVGDIPLANKIQITQDEDELTTAVVRGERGAVFPNAFVAVQNLYTGDREIFSANAVGEFTIRLYGQHQTPYWIGAFLRFPSDDAINSATGTIIYGDGADTSFYVEQNLGGTVPRFRINGDVNTTDLENQTGLNFSFDIEFDITDNLPPTDQLGMQLEVSLLSVGDYVRDGFIDTVIVTIPPSDITRDEAHLRFEAQMQFDRLRRIYGRVVPVIKGYIQVGTSEPQRWENNPIFGLLDDNAPEFTSVLPIEIDHDSSSLIHPTDIKWGLLLDEFHHGTRGIFPQLNAMDVFYSFPVKLLSELNVLPPGTYSLEPTQVSAIDFRFTNGIAQGALTVEVQRPDGQLDRFDAEIVQGQGLLNQTTIEFLIDNPDLKNYPFDDYGDYMITLSGSVTIGDKEYAGGGTYAVRIAESLYLTPSLMFGTPLEVGDTIPLGVHIVPQLPAEISVDVTLLPLNGSEPRRSEFEGQANSRGYFAGEKFLINATGWYTITYTATYEDSRGRFWSSERVTTAGGIADDKGQLLGNGKRGLADVTGIQQAWFDTTIYPNDDINAGRQPYFPYYSGDVAYILDAPDSGIVPIMTAPESLNLEGDVFSIVTVTRPDGILRQFYGDKTYDNDVGFNGEDTFNRQIGAGLNGLQEGDYVFMFGGVDTDNDKGFLEMDSAIYGALAIVEDEDLPARVFSPFMDTLKIYGQEHEIFFVPTGVRPAQVMTLGDILAIIGQVAPTLPTELAITITSPSGELTRFTDIANAIGYFYSPNNDIELNEVGIWTVDISMTFRGVSSSGQIERPFPGGELSFPVYVVSPNNSLLGEAEFMTETRRVTQTYAMNTPEGWTDVRAVAMVSTLSAILIQEELTVFPSGTSYTYNPTTIGRDYPNIEILETAEGNHVADVLILTLVLSGRDAGGNPAIQARTYTITHDVTYTVDEGILR